jgi:hypothetical protein
MNGSLVRGLLIAALWVRVLLESEVVSAQNIPEEYESMGGHGLGLNDAAVASADGIAAVRVNPGLLSRQRIYNFACGYHWPTEGRDFYQAGVVDGKTSKIAAGISYTSFQENYVYFRQSSQASVNDAPIARRGSIALSQSFEQWSIGFGVTYVEGFPFWSEMVREPSQLSKPPLRKGLGANAGISWTLSSNVDAGLAVENASNKKISAYLPRTLRGGVSYRWSKDIQFLFDYRNRERIPEFESLRPFDLDNVREAESLDAEQSLIGGFDAQFYEVMRLTGSFGGSNDARRFAAAGLAITNKGFTIAYNVRRPNLQKNANHQAISMSLDLSI